MNDPHMNRKDLFPTIQYDEPKNKFMQTSITREIFSIFSNVIEVAHLLTL